MSINKKCKEHVNYHTQYNDLMIDNELNVHV